MHFIPESNTRNAGRRNVIAVGTNYQNIFLPLRLQNFKISSDRTRNKSRGESDGCAMHASLSGDDSTLRSWMSGKLENVEGDMINFRSCLKCHFWVTFSCKLLQDKMVGNTRATSSSKYLKSGIPRICKVFLTSVLYLYLSSIKIRHERSYKSRPSFTSDTSKF